MKLARIAVILGILLSIGGLLTWFLCGKLEWSEREVWVGYSGEAVTNDFLAAQRLLERMGQRTSSIRGLPVDKRLPGRNDVMILPRRQVHILPGQVQSLVEWVKGGGLLLTEGLGPEFKEAETTQDLLFDALGARMVWRPEHGLEDAETVPSFDRKRFDESNRILLVEVGGRQYRVRMDAWSEILDLRGEAARAAGNDSGIKLLQYDLGKGRVILCTDLSSLSNGNIAEEDHAGFLAALVLDWAPGNQAWIVHREQLPSLVAWLRDNAWMPLAALALVTAAGLWSAAPRFGPPIPDPVEGRRSLLEHLTACGRFQWARQNGGLLLRATREATLAKLRRAHPGWSHLEPDELQTRLSEFSGLSGERLARALYQERFTDPRTFTEAIQTLDLIRKKL